MEVRNVYQDTEGKWHIEYDWGHLMGLAIRVYFGEILIVIFITLPLLILATMALGNSLQEKKNISPNPDSSVLQKSVCNELSN